MIAKIQKKYVVTIGSNNKTTKENDLDEYAARLEQIGNSQISGARFHIFAKEDE